MPCESAIREVVQRRCGSIRARNHTWSDEIGETRKSVSPMGVSVPLMTPKNRQADNERPCVKDLSSEWGCERCDGPISSGLHRKGKNSEADALWASSLRLTTFVGVLKRGKHHQRRPDLLCGQSHIADDWCRSQHNERTLHIEMHAFKEFREHSRFPGTTLVSARKWSIAPAQSPPPSLRFSSVS
jgi:hypothetical protein